MTYAKALQIQKPFDIQTMNEVIKTTCPQDWFLLSKERLKKICSECFNTNCVECWNNECKGEFTR